MLINAAALAAVTAGFNTIFNTAFDEAQSDWDKIAMEVKSTGAEETYGWLGRTTKFREWLGDRVIQNLATHAYTIRNKEFENTVEVSRNAIEDDSLGIYKPLIQQMGIDSKVHPDTLVFALLKAGFTTACYDGQYFFDADHPVQGEDGTTKSVSNMQEGAKTPWYLLDVSKAIRPFILQTRRKYNLVAKDKPEDDNVFHRSSYLYGVDARLNVGYGLWQMAYGSRADLTAANYGAARAAMMSLKGDNGQPLGVRPTLLVVPPELETQALEILTAERTANGATNIYRNTATALITPWLA